MQSFYIVIWLYNKKFISLQSVKGYYEQIIIMLKIRFLYVGLCE